MLVAIKLGVYRDTKDAADMSVDGKTLSFCFEDGVYHRMFCDTPDVARVILKEWMRSQANNS